MNAGYGRIREVGVPVSPTYIAEARADHKVSAALLANLLAGLCALHLLMPGGNRRFPELLTLLVIWCQMCHRETPLLLLKIRAHWMPNMDAAKPRSCNGLHINHGLVDNVPGNSYVVKASGLAPPGHSEDLGIVPGLTPEAKQHKICLTKRKGLRAGTPIVENVFIQQQIQLMERDVEV